MKLSYSVSAEQKRKSGTEKQELEVVVDFDPSDNSFSITDVFLFINGKPVAEISRILNDCKGNPLSAVVDSIDWMEVYADAKFEEKIPVENKE